MKKVIEENTNPPIVVVCGATATGKTSLALSLCKEFEGEIVSADSRQIYRELDIGSGRGVPSQEDVSIVDGVWHEQGIPIHLYNALKPTEQITVTSYRHLALETLQDIWQRGKLPFLVGGTGFYISAVLGDTAIEEIPPNPALREALDLLSMEKLNQKLEELDPETHAAIDTHNKRRLIRAIERAEYKKDHNVPTPIQVSLDPLMIGLTAPREFLYKRIDERTQNMIDEGLLDEVKLLVMKYGQEAPALDAIGYRQFAPYFIGEKTLEESIEIKNNAEHQYAKRQLTWFKRDSRINWYDVEKTEAKEEKALFDLEIKELVRSYIEKRTETE